MIRRMFLSLVLILPVISRAQDSLNVELIDDYFGTLQEPHELVIQGSLAYVACRERGVHILDMTDPEYPGSVEFIHVENLQEIELRGNLLYTLGVDYVGADVSTIQAFDLEDMFDPQFPGHPREVARFDTTGELRDLCLHRERLYAVRKDTTVVSLDIGNPDTIAVGTSYSTSAVNYASIAAEGDWLYAGGTPFSNPGGSGILSIFDISDQDWLTHLSTTVIDSFTGWLNELEVDQEGYLYALAFDDLVIVNVSDPYQPVHSSSLEIEGLTASDFRTALCIEDGLAYVGGVLSDSAYMAVVNIEDDEAPYVMNMIALGTTSPDFDLSDIQIVGNTLFTTSRWEGVRTYSLSNPQAPTLLTGFSGYDLRAIAEGSGWWGSGGGAAWVAGKGGLYGIEGLESTLLIPHELPTSWWDPLLLEQQDGYLYVAMNNAVEIYDVRQVFEGEAPVEIITTDGTIAAIELTEDRLYVLTRPGGNHQTSDFYVYNISVPELPQLIGETSRDGVGQSDLGRLEVYGDFAYVLFQPSNDLLFSLDLRDESAPVFSEPLFLDNVSGSLAVHNGYAYVGNFPSGMTILSLADPMNPVVVGSITTSAQANDMLVDPNGLLIVGELGLLSFYDLTNPEAPALLGYYESRDAMMALAKGPWDNTVWAIEGEFVRLYEYDPIAMPAQEEPVAVVAAPTLGCFPNPFNANTTIRFALDRNARVSLTVFDVTGRQVATLLKDEFLTSGEQSVPFDGAGLSSGTYFYRLAGEGIGSTQRMVLLK